MNYTDLHFSFDHLLLSVTTPGVSCYSHLFTRPMQPRLSSPLQGGENC